MKLITALNLLFLLILFYLPGCSPDTKPMVTVVQGYHAAVTTGDPQKLLSIIDSESRAYLLQQLELIKSDDRETIVSYVNQSTHPVLHVDMIARALNHYDQAQIDTLSPSAFLQFDLGHLIQLEETALEGFVFREALLVTDQRSRLRFARSLDDNTDMVADFEVVKEGGEWKFNLTDRLHVLENNARVVLKYAEQNTWDYVAEKLNKYYPE